MSTVRMCDFQTENGPCGTIFSEREVGWSTGRISVIGDDGDMVTEIADFCPDHTSQPKERKGKLPRFRATVPSALLPHPPVAPPSTESDPWDTASTTS